MVIFKELSRASCTPPSSVSTPMTPSSTKRTADVYVSTRLYFCHIKPTSLAILATIPRSARGHASYRKKRLLEEILSQETDPYLIEMKKKQARVADCLAHCNDKRMSKFSGNPRVKN
ncbi:hypothetical protein TNCV_4038581 [Trichonephila clavipes]|nr:hypothetical protein TNCV_4038581 [Trichonephila clavipes]